MNLKIGDYVHFKTELDEEGYGKIVYISNNPRHNNYPHPQKYVVQLDMVRTSDYIGWKYNMSGEVELNKILPKGYLYWWLREIEITEANLAKVMETE